MVLSEKHKKNMKEVAQWLRDNPNVEIEYDFFSNTDEEDPSSLDNHTIGDPIGWAAAILGRPAGVSFIQFAQEMLGIETTERVWHFLADRVTEVDGEFIHRTGVLTVAEFVASQFDWIADGNRLMSFWKNWTNN